LWPSSKYPKRSPRVLRLRKNGRPERAPGLTKPAIVEAAAKLIESAGVNGFSLRKLAKALGVGPTTIHFHFKGAGGGIYAAIVVRALAGATRPFKPKEEPSAYLGELLFKILEALHARPVTAKFVVLQLSANPLMDPLLAERLLLVLGALGVPTEARPRLFQRAMGCIFDMMRMVDILERHAIFSRSAV
jgi:TetR/AcrR family transcriptional regulator, tetracycline repressor protein